MSHTDNVEVFMHDVVCRIYKDKFRVGFVLETHTMTHGTLKEGEILVLWTDSSDSVPQVCDLNAVKLLCRRVSPGEVIRKIENGAEIRGLCRGVNANVDVRILGTQLIVTNVDAKRLGGLQPFAKCSLVSHQQRFGVITSCDFNVMLSSVCGSVVEFRHKLNEHVARQNTSFAHRKLPEHYFVGHSITLRPGALVAPVWYKKTGRIKRRFEREVRFTVINVKVYSVNLLVEVGANGLEQYIVPECEIPDLQVLQMPVHKVPRIGSWRTFNFESTDVVTTRRQWNQRQTAKFYDNTYKDGDRPLKPAVIRKLLENPKLSVEVVNINAKADVIWQDGSACEVPTVNVSYPISLDEHAFLPGEWVIREGGWHLGVIQKVLTTDRIAAIKWYQFSCDGDKGPAFVETNEVSVYDLRKLEYGNFLLGEIVRNECRVERNIGIVAGVELDGHVAITLLNGTTDKWWPHVMSLVTEQSVVRHAAHAAQHVESEGHHHDVDGRVVAVGYVDDKNGIEDNNNNNDDDDDDDGDDGSVEDDSEFSWHTESESTDVNIGWREFAGQLDFIRKRLMFLKNAMSGCSNLEDTSTILKSLLYVYTNCSALNRLLETSIFNMESERYLDLFARIKVKMENLTEDEQPMCEGGCDYCLVTEIVQLLEECIDLAYVGIMNKVVAEEQGYSRACEMQTADGLRAINASGCVQPPDTSSTSAVDSSSSLCQPDVSSATAPDSSAWQLCPSEKVSLLIRDEADSTHRYYEQPMEAHVSQRFFRTMMAENKLLRECLPPGIWVYTFADRLDLLTAMIRGPEQTPYEDGLFLFDLQLVDDYPRSPPKCSYISYSSEQLNPNLYVEGRVCISLLGTWSGRGTEMWGPNSNLLQLLVSIQGLILVAEPYYNEAGYDTQQAAPEGTENSRTYNENVILRLVQSLTEMLLRPNNVYKARIFQHFQQQGAPMLKRMRNLLDEPVVNAPKFPLLPLSKGLKLSLKFALDQFERTLIDTKCIAATDVQS